VSRPKATRLATSMLTCRSAAPLSPATVASFDSSAAGRVRQSPAQFSLFKQRGAVGALVLEPVTALGAVCGRGQRQQHPQRRRGTSGGIKAQFS
jgi:hypothetical protein